MRIAIVGGGIMGITLGFYLTKQGYEVDVYEASPVLGGLAGPVELADGTPVDRFYHAILPSDSHLNALCRDVGVEDQMRYGTTQMGFLYEGAIYPMNGVVDFLRFPPLGWIDRARLGATVLAAQSVRDWHFLETISVEEWLLRWSGPNTYRNIWQPMLRAKFDGNFQDVPATWIWSRLVRTKSTRSGASQQESAGYLIGGYSTLVTAMARQIAQRRGTIHLNIPVQEIIVEDGRATGLRIDGDVLPYAAVVSTLQAPIFARLIPGADEIYRNSLLSQTYLGVVCVLLALKQRLTDFWTVNITESDTLLTGIIETTQYIDPAHVGGHHLVYLPKYTAPGSAWQQRSDDEIAGVWLDSLEQMLPSFDRSIVHETLVHRERFVEPLHGLGGYSQIPAVRTPIASLYLATTAQIYPALTNGESVSRHARTVTDMLVEDVQAQRIQDAADTVPNP